MTEIILTSGTSWTVPNDCTSATVECIGGGQGGNATNGGNGGDYAKANAVALTPGASIAIAIGAGGAGVASGSQNAGGDTSFGSAVLAKGGGSASADVGDVTYAGGAGDAAGAGGGAAGAGGAGSSASGTTPGAGDGDLAGAGGAPAPPSGPAFVQGNINAPSGALTSIGVTLPATATAGNLLVASVMRAASTTPPNSVPAGWTLADSNVSRSPMLWVYTKTSDGTETGVTFGFAAGAASAASITEWSGKLGTTANGTQPSANGTTFASPGAPASSTSIPLWLFTGGTTMTSFSISPGTWTTNRKNNGYPNTIGYSYAPAPNAAVSATASWTPSMQDSWVFLWIDPK